MNRLVGLREDVQLALALKKQINQWLLATNQQAKQIVSAPSKKNS